MHTTINVHGRLLDLSRPIVMGIMNVTPDSFYADSRLNDEAAIIGRARQIVAEGGSIIDIGACSTRPGSTAVSEHDELQRLSVALPLVRRELPDAVISIDTFRPAVARRCVLEWGADMVNDVSGDIMEGIECLRVPYILTSQEPTINAMMQRWAAQTWQLAQRGVTDVILDPGFGFGKTLRDNYDIIASLPMLRVFKMPLLVGLSRKSMICRLLNIAPEEALTGTTVLNTIALQSGASILRVHDVREAVQTITLSEAIRQQEI